jgi:hypothetical protein
LCFFLLDEIFCLPLYAENSRIKIDMTGINARHHSVSDPKTAISRGQALPAAIQQVTTLADSPSAAIPETVIIGDRGHSHLAVHITPQMTSSVITILNNSSNFRNDDPQQFQQTETKQAEDHTRGVDRHHLLCH